MKLTIVRDVFFYVSPAAGLIVGAIIGIQNGFVSAIIGAAIGFAIGFGTSILISLISVKLTLRNIDRERGGE